MLFLQGYAERKNKDPDYNIPEHRELHGSSRLIYTKNGRKLAYSLTPFLSIFHLYDIWPGVLHLKRTARLPNLFAPSYFGRPSQRLPAGFNHRANNAGRSFC